MQLSRGSKEDAGGALLGRMPFEGDSVGHSVVFDALNVSILFQSVLDSSKLISVIMEVRSIGRRSVAW